MQQHMKAAVACAREVLPLFEDMAAGRTDAFASRRKAIDELEHQADDIKNAIRSRLPRRLFMAFERRDMLDILDNQDSIADYAQDVAQLVDLRSMVIPQDLREPLLDLVRKVIATCDLAEKVIEELDELVETGFSGRTGRARGGDDPSPQRVSSPRPTSWRSEPSASCSRWRTSSGSARSSGTG